MVRALLTAVVHTLAELGFHLAVWPFTGQLTELAGHGGSCDNSLEAALAFGHILLGVKDNYIDFGHVEHSQRHRCTQAQRHGQSGRLDVHLQ